MDARVSRAERLETLRVMISMPRVDVETALALLNGITPTEPGMAEAVQHAQEAVAAIPGGDNRHEAIGRYMVARVAVLLELERDSLDDQTPPPST